MKIKTLNDLFTDMIKDLYNAENQLIKALPKMAKKCNTPQLKKSMEMHLEETVNQKARLEKVCELLEISPKGKKCAAMEGLIKEAEELMDEVKDKDVLEAGLIAAAQKVEHYEIASYGTVCTYAKMLGKNQVAKLLHQTLEEEKAADLKLTEVAEGMVNEKALQEA
ncbi:MAG: ferritin-like domain-containing protein [Cytophagaceae bacterium]|nr:ferritin-like domain-containing protein [Cytophagaceae bacterium]